MGGDDLGLVKGLGPRIKGSTNKSGLLVVLVLTGPSGFALPDALLAENCTSRPAPTQ